MNEILAQILRTTLGDMHPNDADEIVESVAQILELDQEPPM